MRTDIDNNKTASIAIISKAFGITPRTLHHWEDVGLLLPERKGTLKSQTRLYDAHDVARISAILALKSSGVKLNDIKYIIKHNKIDSQKIKEFEEKLSSLSQANNIISSFIPRYSDNYPIEEYTLHSQYTIVKSKWIKGILDAHKFYRHALVDCMNDDYQITPNYSIFCQYPLNKRHEGKLHFERDYFLMRFFMPVRKKFSGKMPEDRFISNEIFRDRPVDHFTGVQTDFVKTTSCHAVSTVHHGTSIATDRAYEKLYDYMDKNGYKQRGLVHEIYLNPPENGRETGNMISRIVLPVESKKAVKKHPIEN